MTPQDKEKKFHIVTCGSRMADGKMTKGSWAKSADSELEAKAIVKEKNEKAEAMGLKTRYEYIRNPLIKSPA